MQVIYFCDDTTFLTTINLARIRNYRPKSALKKY